jgi:hypothetical protein
MAMVRDMQKPRITGLQVVAFLALGLVALALVLFGTHSDPGARIVGQLKLDGPVPSGVRAHLSTPEGMLTIPRDVSVDRNGRFEFRGVGCIPLSAVVRIDGLQDRHGEMKIGDHCSRRVSACPVETCSEVTIALSL